MSFILAKKIGMTTLYQPEGAKNVTLLEVGKNVVVGIRTKEKDGYQAVQVGLIGKQKQKKEGEKKESYVSIKEFQVDSLEGYETGKELGLEAFKEKDKIFIKGTTKGKGYQGVVKRHGFAGSPASHGHRHDLRAPGSIGCAFPERVFKGKRMAGRMGSDNITYKGKVALVDSQNNLIAIKGGVPGNNGSVISIQLI